jgi:hypothetical protein
MGVMSTVTDPAALSAPRSDEVIQLRPWGSDQAKRLRRPDEQGPREVLLGAARECDVRIVDPERLVSARHARLVFEDGAWKIHDLKSKNGLWLDRRRCDWGVLRAGMEIGLGRKFVLLAESARSIELRMLLARMLGWSGGRAKVVDLALRSVYATVAQRGAFALCSESDPVALAQSIHRVAFGPARPFITCDPKRRSTTRSVRWTRNVERGMDALAAAAGGTLCVWASRLPRDFDRVWAALVEPTATARLVVCANRPIDGRKFLTTPIVVPSLATRPDELRFVIREYSIDAVAELTGRAEALGQDDLDWILAHEAGSLAKIETATLRLAALRRFPNLNQAAERLGMARMSLAAWIGRRALPMALES